MKAVYVQRGESLNFKNGTEKKIEAGGVVVFGSRIGIAGMDIMPGETGSIHVVDVFRIRKKEGEEIAAGADVYYTEDGITAVAGEALVSAGYAAEPAAAGDADVLVRLA